MPYQVIKGDLISLAQQGSFDVIAHGANCFNTMKAGIAPKMAKAFGVDRYTSELSGKGEMMKLGNIEWNVAPVCNVQPALKVVNAYTQYSPWAKGPDGCQLDYTALRMCLRKMNHYFKGKKVGLPQIGCGLAGGDWTLVQSIIMADMPDCDVTVVEYSESDSVIGQPMPITPPTRISKDPLLTGLSSGGPANDPILNAL